MAIYSVAFIFKYGATDYQWLTNIHTLITHLTIGLTEKVQICTYNTYLAVSFLYIPIENF